MRWRVAAGAVLAVIVAVVIYMLLFANSGVTPTIRIAYATAVLGSGDGAAGVTPDGEVLSGPAPEAGAVPSLPDVAPPKNGRLSGPMLAQAKVLGAAPEPLRPCIERSFLGESGVDVELDSGIDVIFGDATRAGEKWAAAIALLANSEITALDYVNVVAPGRPSVGGSGHSLPSTEEGSESGCGE